MARLTDFHRQHRATASAAPFPLPPPPYKGATTPPLHPAPLPFSPPSPQRCCRRAPPPPADSTAEPPRPALLPSLRPPGKIPGLLLSLSMYLPLEMVHESPIWPSSCEPPPRRPPASRRRAGRPPPAVACTRLGSFDQRGWSRSKGGAYPFDPIHGGPVDQVHKRRSTALRQHRVSPANHSLPRGATAAPPLAALAILQKEPLVSGIHKYTFPPI
jgi:hypothetical protein